ncbi:MAG TPA: hypothetical protein VN843_17165 [Anaerolineales bacterium]|nr:hypothetical protein [Anaerolineales bacterium]
MYQWIVFLHVFFAFAFMLVHGVSAVVMLSFRREPDPERSITFFNILPSITITRGLTLLMGISGFIAAFLTIWWRQGWVWASFAVYLIISYIMYKYGGGYYGLIYGAANRLIEARKTNTNVEEARKEFDEARNAPHPMAVSVVGIAGLAIILWLMRFKPF